MQNFVNLLPELSEKFTNIDDFHDFLKTNIECDIEHKYIFSTAEEKDTADTSVTSVIKEHTYVNDTIKAAGIVGEEVHTVLEKCVLEKHVVGKHFKPAQEKLLDFVIGRSGVKTTELPMVIGVKVEDGRVIKMGGTIDFVCDHKAGSTTIIDYKTSSKEMDTDWKMQLSMYSMMYKFLRNLYCTPYTGASDTIVAYIFQVPELSFKFVGRSVTCNFQRHFSGTDLESYANFFLKKLETKYALVVERSLTSDEMKDLNSYLALLDLKRSKEIDLKEVDNTIKVLKEKLIHLFDERKSLAKLEGSSIRFERTPTARCVIDAEAAKRCGFLDFKEYDDRLNIILNDIKIIL
jgi:CRISPR/Cas system-associated exonuclease Cas4 (RecB family)